MVSVMSSSPAREPRSEARRWIVLGPALLLVLVLQIWALNAHSLTGDGAYHLIARRDARIEAIADLKNKTIALPSKGSTQHTSFWFLASHYGIDESSITALPMSNRAARSSACCSSRFRDRSIARS